MPENTITLSLKNGNRDDFNQLFRFYYPRIVAYVASLLGDNLIAEDITQDVFLYVWENRKKLIVSKGFHSYLFQMAYTRCLDYFRKTKVSEKYNEQILNDHKEQYEALLEKDEQALKSLYTIDFFEQLHNLLNKIPAERREVFILSYIKGISTKEIAESLGIPKRTVESHLYLTLKYLRANMSEKDFFLLFIYYQLYFMN